MLGGRSSSSNLVTKKGIMRPDARDLRNNVGGTLADPYYGNYPWIYPPPEAIPINRRASIVAPAYGVQTLVTSFQVPQAMEAVINAILCKFDGAGFTQGSGEITWVIDINRPLGAGGAGLGYSPPDFSIITTQLGDNIQSGPWPVPGGIRLSERDTIRFKVTTGAPVGIGSPNLITCMFLGWYWPSRLQFPVKG
jgi:hypothetical protein